MTRYTCKRLQSTNQDSSFRATPRPRDGSPTPLHRAAALSRYARAHRRLHRARSPARSRETFPSRPSLALARPRARRVPARRRDGCRRCGRSDAATARDADGARTRARGRGRRTRRARGEGERRMGMGENSRRGAARGASAARVASERRRGRRRTRRRNDPRERACGGGP